MKEQIERILDKGTKREAKIEKTVAISFDGDQFLVRIPKKISDLFKMKKGCKIKFIVNLSYAEETKKNIMVVEILDKNEKSRMQ
jgi:hypothetical protein